LAATRFILNIKRWGVRSQITQCQLYIGNQLAACQAPIINDGTFSIAVNSFVAGDFSEATGLTGNGLTKFINTGGATPTATDNAHVSVYIRVSSGANSTGIGSTDTANTTLLSPNLLGTTYGALWANVPGNRTATTDSSGVGYYNLSRTATNSLIIYKNGASFDTSTNPAGSKNNAGVYVHAFNNNGLDSSWSSSTFAFYSVGGGLTVTQELNLWKAVQRLQITMGRSVGSTAL